MTQGVCEVLRLKRVFEELKQTIDLPIRLYCDNKSAINNAHNPVLHDITKHVEVGRHLIKEKLEGNILYIFCSYIEAACGYLHQEFDDTTV